MSLLTNLIAYWKMDEASGNALDAHNVGPYDLTDHNSIGAGTGVINGARGTFVTNKYFSHADNADLSGSGDFTVAAWVNFTGLAGDYAIVSKWFDTGNNREILLAFNNGALSPANRIFLGLSGDGAANSFVFATTFGALTTGVLYYVVGWYDSANSLMGISVNDVADTASYSSGVFDGTADFNVGAFENGTAWNANALIDEVGFWKRTLTSGERTSLYAGGAGLPYSSFGGGGSSVGANAQTYANLLLAQGRHLAPC